MLSGVSAPPKGRHTPSVCWRKTRDRSRRRRCGNGQRAPDGRGRRRPARARTSSLMPPAWAGRRSGNSGLIPACADAPLNWTCRGWHPVRNAVARRDTPNRRPGQAARRRKREAKLQRKQDVRRDTDFRLAWQALGGAVNALAALARERTDDVRLRRTAIAVIEAAKTMQAEIER